MTWQVFGEILLDSLKDSILVFAFVFLFHVILSFVETPVSNFLIKRKKIAPIFGSLFGLIPQCGTSVVAAELYVKRYITLGTIIAVFLSCSDEALLVLITSWNEKSLAIFPLIGLKLVTGIVIGILVDLVMRRQKVEDVDHVEEKTECHTHHHENTPAHAHLIHPLIHAIKVFIYIFIINLTLGIIIALVGKDNFADFMTYNRYLTPLYCSIIGLIPNCSSSILITELYVSGSLSFGALFAGLLVNSGLGVMVLLKDKKNIKNGLLIVLFCFAVAIVFGYLTCLVNGF